MRPGIDNVEQQRSGVIPRRWSAWGKPYAGQTIGVWTLATDTWSKYQAQMSAQFNKRDRIKVNFNDIPKRRVTDKLKLAQIAKDSSYDVWEGDQAFRAEYDGRNANQPLDSIINNPSQTPKDFLSDFPPAL